MPVANINGLDIWYETWGQSTRPALLLVAGGCSQGILWPQMFCERLVAAGFYVIRYDYRDTGQSSCIDYSKNPYNLSDLAQDAIALLKFLKIQKAHVLGHSMGGSVAALLAGSQPDVVKSLSLYAATCDMRPANLAFAKLPKEPDCLPGPTEQYLQWMYQFMAEPPQDEAAALAQRLAGWRILNGSKAPFEEAMQYELHLTFLRRTQRPEALGNHILACRASEDLIRLAPTEVNAPTVVIHGSEDAILPAEHGIALARTIKGSRLVLIDGLGHVLNRQFYDEIVQAVQENSSLY